MEEVQRFVGIDVAKAALDVCIGSDGTAFSLVNDEVAIRQLLKQLTPADFVILEATGGLEMPVASGLAAAGIAVAAGIVGLVVAPQLHHAPGALEPARGEQKALRKQFARLLEGPLLAGRRVEDLHEADEVSNRSWNSLGRVREAVGGGG